jgi:hypothetical protein
MHASRSAEAALVLAVAQVVQFEVARYRADQVLPHGPVSARLGGLATEVQYAVALTVHEALIEPAAVRRDLHVAQDLGPRVHRH